MVLGLGGLCPTCQAAEAEARRLPGALTSAPAIGEALVERVARVIRLLELAWHDIHGELSPPDEVVDDVLTCSNGLSKDSSTPSQGP